MSWNTLLCAGAATSFTSPLTECTSAIHNLDNIQNGVPSFTANKKISSLPVAGRSKDTALAAQKLLLPVATKKYTNDPYKRTALCGAHLFTPPALSPEASFMLSYGEEEKRASRGVKIPAAAAPPPQLPQPLYPLAPGGDHKSAQRGGAQAPPPFYNILPSVPAVAASDGARQATAAATERAATTPKTGYAAARHVKPRGLRNGVSVQPSLATASCSAAATASTSVTHVRCKRVYVNGRPVTVWLNGDGETI